MTKEFLSRNDGTKIQAAKISLGRFLPKTFWLYSR